MYAAPAEDVPLMVAGNISVGHSLMTVDELSEYDVRLEIQKFLISKTAEGMSFESIKELLSEAPYHISVSEKGGLVLFRYSQLDSDWNEPICRECRGLILEKGTWKVVRYAFDKFFNINEDFAAEIDWGSAVGTEKIDGSLISLYFYNGRWRVATNGMIDAYDAPLSPNERYKTYGELWEAAVNSNYPDFLTDRINVLSRCIFLRSTENSDIRSADLKFGNTLRSSG